MAQKSSTYDVTHKKKKPKQKNFFWVHPKQKKCFSEHLEQEYSYVQVYDAILYGLFCFWPILS